MLHLWNRVVTFSEYFVDGVNLVNKNVIRIIHEQLGKNASLKPDQLKEQFHKNMNKIIEKVKKEMPSFNNLKYESDVDKYIENCFEKEIIKYNETH